MSNILDSHFNQSNLVKDHHLELEHQPTLRIEEQNTFPREVPPVLKQKMPDTMPDDMVKLIHNLTTIESIRQFKDKLINFQDEELEEISSILSDTKGASRDISNRIKDFYLTKP